MQITLTEDERSLLFDSLLEYRSATKELKDDLERGYIPLGASLRSDEGRVRQAESLGQRILKISRILDKLT